LRLSHGESIGVPTKMGSFFMPAFPPMRGARKHPAARAILAGLICAGAAAGAVHGQGTSSQSASIPNFSPSPTVGWLKAGAGDEFLPPDTGPGPVVYDTTIKLVGNFQVTTGNNRAFKVGDLTNPILQPWVKEQMRKSNQEVLAGKVAFTARARCWPHGVPGFVLYPVHPIFFIQAPKEVVMVWGQDFQVRHVYLNVPHSTKPKPSWYGESVGHYENGDTLVVDTIGLNDKSYVDNFRTPHTTELHVVERFKLLDNGRGLEVNVRVEDAGAFTMPWNAVSRFRRDQRETEVPLHEMLCAENNEDYFDQGLVPIPLANKPDF
jgi:hypothetical protein